MKKKQKRISNKMAAERMDLMHVLQAYFQGNNMNFKQRKKWGKE